MAKYIYDKQVMQVAEGLDKVYDYVKRAEQKEVPVVVTGLGKDFIARKAAEKIGAESIVDLGTLNADRCFIGYARVRRCPDDRQ